MSSGVQGASHRRRPELERIWQAIDLNSSRISRIERWMYVVTGMMGASTITALFNLIRGNGG